MSKESQDLLRVRTGAWVGEGPGTRKLKQYPSEPLTIDGYVEGTEFVKYFPKSNKKILHTPPNPSFTSAQNQESIEEDIYVPITQPSNPDRIRRKISRDLDYLQLKLSFDEAVAETLKHYKLAKKSDLVNKRQIKDIDTAHHLLASFREKIVINDSSRLGHDVSVREAKKLNNQEQGMFKLLLQRELGLDFGNNPAGETNHKYFMFTVDRALLDNLGKNRITAK